MKEKSGLLAFYFKLNDEGGIHTEAFISIDEKADKKVHIIGRYLRELIAAEFEKIKEE